MNSFLLILLIVRVTNSAVLMWTPKQVLIPALQPFTKQNLLNLVNELDNPPVSAYKATSLKAALQLHRKLNHNNTVYLLKPGSDIVEDLVITEINEDSLFEPIDINNTLLVLVIEDDVIRTKRNLNNTEEIVEEVYITEIPDEPEPVIKGPVLYTFMSDKKEEVMIYSSKPLLLYVNDAAIYLGNASMTFNDVRESYTRLIARIITANNRIIVVRFIFTMISGYWYLNFVEVEDNSIKYNLALVNNNITAPNHMSYHCENETLFNDIKSNISLYLYDLQAQPDANHHRFSAAYNCIPFTTAPILSGLFVTSIMGIGLAIGLMALSSIKTMDKFDNSKTKQLSVTLFE